MEIKGFTLTELLAIIIILAIILAIASPLVSNIINNARKEAFADDAKLVLKGIEYKRLNDPSFDPTTITKSNMMGLLKISDVNYYSITIKLADSVYNTEIIGANKWEGLRAYGTLQNITVENYVIPVNADTSGANAPVLEANMIPVKWDGTSWVKADAENKSGPYSWYNYNAKEWANVVTVTEATRSKYLNAAAGTKILEDDILTYFVWIPRYRYAVPSGSGPRQIDIVFESKSTKKSAGNATGTNYLTHPAFTFGSTELSGIWVGKFETTGTIDSLSIKPNMSSIVDQKMSSMFNATQKMQETNNIYGFPTSGIDAHIMKNIEWGSVVYLSHSQYGTNTEIWINPNMYMKTGCAGDSATAAISEICNTYTTTNGIKASTTGNVYGIYDMNGGAEEMVMGNYDNTISNSGFSNMPDSKYYDLYTGNNGNKGDATNADGTSGWYGDGASLVNSDGPWQARGGNNSNGTKSGLFDYNNSYGGSQSSYSFRVVLSAEA